MSLWHMQAYMIIVGLGDVFVYDKDMSWLDDSVAFVVFCNHVTRIHKIKS